MVLIRKAESKDILDMVPLLSLVLEEFIYIFMGKEDKASAQEFIFHFAQLPNNQFSYQNCIVAEENGKIVGLMNIYDGAEVERLNAPIQKYVQDKYQYISSSDPETQAGEYYIDTLAVALEQQGKGIGSKLLDFAVTHYNENGITLGLLVDIDNPKAEKLYLKKGFQHVGFKSLSGKSFKHLQKLPI